MAFHWIIVNCYIFHLPHSIAHWKQNGLRAYFCFFILYAILILNVVTHFHEDIIFWCEFHLCQFKIYCFLCFISLSFWKLSQIPSLFVVQLRIRPIPCPASFYRLLRKRSSDMRWTYLQLVSIPRGIIARTWWKTAQTFLLLWWILHGSGSI